MAGLGQPSLFETQPTRPHYLIVTAGRDPAIAGYRAAEDPGGISATKIASRVTKNVASAASKAYSLGVATVAQAPRFGASLGWPEWTTSAAESLVSGIGIDTTAEVSKKGPPIDPQAAEKGEPTSLAASIRDPPRHAQSLAMAPRGPLIAVTDGLGRVLLLDTNSFAVIRIWKGYRDAHCAFLEAPLQAAKSSRQVATSGSATVPRRHTELGLCLAIFAPRKGLLELWRMRTGPRVAVVRCGSNCRLLQPSPCFGAFLSPQADLELDRARAYLLHGDGGQLSEILVPSLSAADRLFPRATSSTGEGGAMSESDIFQRLCDLLRQRPGSLAAARQAAVYLEARATQEVTAGEQPGEEEKKEVAGGGGEGEEKERVAVQLLEALATPMRKLRALDMVVALHPSLSPTVHLAAIHAVIASLSAALEPPSLAGPRQRMKVEQSIKKSPAGSGLVVAGGKHMALPPAAPEPVPDVNHSTPGSLTAGSLRRRLGVREPESVVLPGVRMREDLAGGEEKEEDEGTSEGDSEDRHEEDWLEQSQVAQEQQLRERIQERLGALKWQEHLVRVYLYLATNEDLPRGTPDMDRLAQGLQSSTSSRSGGRAQARNGEALGQGSGREVKPVRLSPARGNRRKSLVVKGMPEESGHPLKWDPGADVRRWVASRKDPVESRPPAAAPSPLPANSAGNPNPNPNPSFDSQASPVGFQAASTGGNTEVGPSNQELTAGDFLRGFVWDPKMEPPAWEDLAESKGAMGRGRAKGLKLVDKDDLADVSPRTPGLTPLDGSEASWLYGGIGKLVFSRLVIGAAGAEKTNNAMRWLPLGGKDWQQLFLGWYSSASLDQILAVDPATFCRFVRRIECSLAEAREAGKGSRVRLGLGLPGGEKDVGGGEVALPDGARWPLCLHWCQVSSLTGQALVLARACSLLADHEVAALSMEPSSMDDEEEEEEDFEDRWHDGAGEDLWLERGADQWRELSKRVEDAFWLGRALRYVTEESDARQLAGRPRWAPSAAELSSFPVATWVSRLQLLVSHSAHVAADLQKTLLSRDSGKLSHQDQNGHGQPIERTPSGRAMVLGRRPSLRFTNQDNTGSQADAKDAFAEVSGGSRTGSAGANQTGRLSSADVSSSSKSSSSSSSSSLTDSLSETSKVGTGVQSGEDETRPSGGELTRGESPEELLRQLLLRFPRSCHPDILAAHRSLELCRQWAGTPPAVEPTEVDGPSVHEVLLAAQEHMALLSTVGLKGGIVSSMWGSLIGPRAASVVSLVQRLGRAPSDEECALSPGLLGPTALATAGIVAAYEQLLVLLYDCAMLAEAGLATEPSSVAHEALLGSADATCRDAVADFRLRPPSSERVHSYMLLLRTVGVALALKVDPVPLDAFFPRDLLTTFPALFQDHFFSGGGGAGDPAGEEEVRLEARLAFLQAALASQRRFNRQLAEGGSLGMSGSSPGMQYATRSIYGLAGDLGVPHGELRARQVQ